MPFDKYSGSPSNTDGSGTPSVPVYSNKVKVFTNFDDINLNSSPGAFVPIFSYNGSGKFIGFDAEFNNDAIELKFNIDGNEVFEDNGNMFIPLNDLKTFGNKEVLTDQVDWQFGLDFSPKFPIIYTQSLLISARAVSGSSRKKTKIIVMLTKET